MEKTYTNKKTLSILLAILLLASALTMIIMTSSVSATNSIASSTAISTYGDFNSENYSYPVGPGGDSGNTFFNAGPHPTHQTSNTTRQVPVWVYKGRCQAHQ